MVDLHVQTLQSFPVVLFHCETTCDVLIAIRPFTISKHMEDAMSP